MAVLADQGELTVTNVAMLSRVNHKRCGTVLMWMVDSGYIETRVIKKKRHVVLTQTGCEYARRMQELSDMTHFSARNTNKMYVQNVNELY